MRKARRRRRVIVRTRGRGRTVPRGAEVIPLDLASLDSVREFAAAVTRQLGDTRIDILVLNAGMPTSTAQGRSVGGYELTLAVNHLAHYLLARLLVPHMAHHGRLVITHSHTHDPDVTPIARRWPTASSSTPTEWQPTQQTASNGYSIVQAEDRDQVLSLAEGPRVSRAWH
jgi:NAD(P)-dependent dehydrogenase (short-subunit alcohol dehydrogenase family)